MGHRCQSQSQDGNAADELRKGLKAFHHHLRLFGDSQGQQQGSQQHRQTVPQGPSQRHSQHQGADQNGNRHGCQTNQVAFGKVGPVIFADKAKSHRDIENNGATKNRRHNYAGKQAEPGITGKFHGQLTAAHIDGQDTAENTGIHMKKITQRCHNSAQDSGQYRCQTDDASHGQGHRSQHPEAVFKLLSIALLVAKYLIDAAQSCTES